jgi:predicted nuclease of predicted toxin-antitoxin system
VRVLLDECVPRRLAQFFGASHTVATVTGLGWAGTKNGRLLRLAADQGFEALVTVDVGLHVSPDTPMRVLVLRAGSNRLEALLPLMPRVLQQLAALPPGRTEIIAARPPV